MLVRLLILFTVVPIVELALLIRLGQLISLWPTLGLVIGTGVVGAWLARREGLRTFAAIRAELARGVMPAARMLDGLMILLAGALLVTPGIITDLIGFAMLVPPCRRLIRQRLHDWLRKRVVVMHPPPHDAPPEFIDVEPIDGNDQRSRS